MFTVKININTKHIYQLYTRAAMNVTLTLGLNGPANFQPNQIPSL